MADSELHRIAAQVRAAWRVSRDPVNMAGELIVRAVELGAFPELASTLAVITGLSGDELAAGWPADSIRKATTRSAAVFVAACELCNVPVTFSLAPEDLARDYEMLADRIVAWGDVLETTLADNRGAGEGKTPKQPAPSKVWLAHAMLLVRDHPDWSNARIAGEVHKHPSTLSRCPEYRAAARLARNNHPGPRRGHLDIDEETGQRGVQAYSNDPEDRDWDE